MKNIKITLYALLVLLLVVVSGQWTATFAADRHKDQPDEVIRLVEQVQTFSFQDVNTPGPSLGDRLIFTGDLFDEANQKVGQDGADCVTVRIDPAAPEQQSVQCTITIALPAGQLAFQGLVRGTENFFAVTCGTGAYRAARGEALVKDRVLLQVADITITLFK